MKNLNNDYKESASKLNDAATICYWAYHLLFILKEQTLSNEKLIVKQPFVDNLPNLTLKEISVLLSTDPMLKDKNIPSLA